MIDSEKFVTVATFNEKVQADICVAMLRDAGIPAAAFGFDSSYPSLGYARSVEVKVNEADYDKALALIGGSAE